MESTKFSYAGKLIEEMFLISLGIGLSIFMAYEIFYTNDILTINSVEAPPLLSEIIMYIFLLISIGLIIISFGNLKNRNKKYVIITSKTITIPKRFSKKPMIIDLHSLENIERQDLSGSEMISFKAKGKFGNFSLESTKFQSEEEYKRFLNCLNEVLN